MKGVREVKRRKFASPVYVMSGDRLALMADDKVLLETPITETAVYTEGMLFEADEGVFGKGKSVGGVFIE